MKSALESTHGAVRFALKESIKSLEKTPNKESLILLHFSSYGRRFKKSIGYKCSLKNWDSGKQKVKTGKGMPTNTYEVNKRIDVLRTFTEDNLSKIELTNGSIDINKLSNLISSRIRGDQEENENEKPQLVSYASDLIESKKSNISITTYRAYNQTIKLLKMFERKNNSKLIFEDIDLSFYRSFIDLMEEENYSLNSIGKHIKNLKTFLNDAFINGLSTNIIFKNRSFRVPKEITTDVFLNNQEIKTLADKDFSNRPQVELARDIFLIGCYTGQRVSDYNGLTEENIEINDGHKFIKICQKKTGTLVHIPITKRIKKIMSRYGNSFPQRLSEPILRKKIKTACSSVGFNEMVSISFTKGGKLIKKEVPKYSLIKTHTARRSFCTNYYIAGKPIQNIMLFSGHKTEREFLKYIRIEKKQEALAIHRSGFFD